MKQFNVILSYLAIISLLAACDMKTPAAPVSPSQSNANNSIGRWEIWGTNPTYSDLENSGWKTVRIELVAENRIFTPAAPSIKIKDAVVFTTLSGTHPVTLFQTTGANKKTTDTIAFQNKYPHGFRIIGEYIKDTLSSYYFEGTIPKDAEAVSIKTPSYYGEIKIKNFSTLLHDKENITTNAPATTVDVLSIGKLHVGAFTRKEYYLPLFDRISATLTITATLNSTTDNVKFNLHYYPLGIVQHITDTANALTKNPHAHIADFIAGTSYTDAPDCKPILEAPPGGSKTSSICMLIPHSATDVHVIIYGDTCAVYQVPDPPK